ncbi:MAG: response regulator transcription factor [Chitinophagaceae bacterium]|nr:response regulator transcription factor [Chitinophagaceae bacterium]MCW5928463.1 response regulator transcription factor [Chitinophagaceae bacterium]
MRILIIEDEIIIARFIEQQLIANFDCSTAVALNQQEAVDTLPVFLPHLILCDINLKEEKDGITLVDTLRQQYAFEVIFITSYQSKAIIERALQYQPLNYVIKPADEAAIFAALKLAWPIVAGNPTLGKLQERIPFDRLLSSTERKIVQFILQRKTTREIAAMLFLSPYTIKNHRHSICRKLGLKDGNNALLKWALQYKELLR